MKVGILTFCRTINYGALLQCYALQETLTQMGHEVVVIDYKQPNIENENTLINYKILKKNIGNLRNVLRHLKNAIIHIPLIVNKNRFRNKFLKLTNTCNHTTIPCDLDVYIIGSDQLWSTQCTKIPDPVFWGDFQHMKSSRLYTYAVSSDVNSINEITNLFLETHICNFKNISVREHRLKEAIEGRLKVPVRVDLDPTLLNKNVFWTPLISIKKYHEKKYIAIYQVRRLSWSKNHLYEEAKYMALKYDYDIVDLSDYKYSADEFISIIFQAEAILTTSFHGTAFSIVFNKPFNVYLLDDGHDERCVNILEMLGLTNCLKKFGEASCIETPNYELVNKQLEKYQEESLKYLKVIVDSD